MVLVNERVNENMVLLPKVSSHTNACYPYRMQNKYFLCYIMYKMLCHSWKGEWHALLDSEESTKPNT